MIRNIYFYRQEVLLKPFFKELLMLIAIFVIVLILSLPFLYCVGKGVASLLDEINSDK